MKSGGLKLWWPRDAFRIRIIRFSKTDSQNRFVVKTDSQNRFVVKTDSQNGLVAERCIPYSHYPIFENGFAVKTDSQNGFAVKSDSQNGFSPMEVEIKRTLERTR